eukprot:12213869-Prorocentrum_lima.AAC.1
MKQNDWPPTQTAPFIKSQDGCGTDAKAPTEGTKLTATTPDHGDRGEATYAEMAAKPHTPPKERRPSTL